MARPKSTIPTSWEYRLLNIMWENDTPVTAVDVVDALKKQGLERSNSAIRKTLRAMTEKGCIDYKKIGKSFHYFPLLNKEQVKDDSVHYITDLFFGGSIYKLAINLLDEKEIDEAFMQSMKAKLKKLDDAHD